MKLKEAIQLLKDHNEWRRFNSIDLPKTSDPKMAQPRELGIAIDTLVKHFETQKLSSELNKKLEDYIIEGLKRKGFEFENRLELETFIKNNCRCEDTPHKKERVYFANDTPFFLHKYEIKITNPITLDWDVKMCTNYGSYAYL